MLVLPADVRHPSIIPVPNMMVAFRAEFPHQFFRMRRNYRGPAFRAYYPKLDHVSIFLLCAWEGKSAIISLSVRMSIGSICFTARSGWNPLL